MSDPGIPDAVSHHRGLWWADASYLGPGVWWRHRRIVPVSLWILRPRYSWRTRR